LELRFFTPRSLAAEGDGYVFGLRIGGLEVGLVLQSWLFGDFSLDVSKLGNRRILEIVSREVGGRLEGSVVDGLRFDDSLVVLPALVGPDRRTVLFLAFALFVRRVDLLDLLLDGLAHLCRVRLLLCLERLKCIFLFSCFNRRS